ncbi:ETS-related transcription factor Elf-1-like isoform X2 [Liolophura sinensis]
MASSDIMAYNSGLSDWVQIESDLGQECLWQHTIGPYVPPCRSLESNTTDDLTASFDSDYFNNSTSSSETENYYLHNMCTYSAQRQPDDDNSSVMIDEIFLRDVDQLDNLEQCPGLPIDHYGGPLYHTPGYSTPACGSYTGRTDNFRQSYSSSPDALSSYSVSPPYENGQPTYVIPNLPNLPDLDTNSSPRRTEYRFGSSSDDVSDSDEEEPRTRKGKRGSKSVLLWKFLLDSLADPDNVPHILKWENKESGIFKFVDTGAVAKMWGQQKRKQDMNFEKLSRGIRHYYKGGMMNRVEGKRLVYKFNWKKVPREYRRKL